MKLEVRSSIGDESYFGHQRINAVSLKPFVPSMLDSPTAAYLSKLQIAGAMLPSNFRQPDTIEGKVAITDGGEK
ncbi:hypothetical protein [Rhizobium gallicum]|uniref:hypothetical protein n=1 Tax=Rhizobium gallicum TaxID=56730 RepID=UPI00093D9AAC|nr:hypothetical protein [Rhizobium gallicum]